MDCFTAAFSRFSSANVKDCILGVRLPTHHLIRDALVLVVSITEQLHSLKSGLRFCAGSKSSQGVSEIHDGGDPCQ